MLKFNMMDPDQNTTDAAQPTATASETAEPAQARGAENETADVRTAALEQRIAELSSEVERVRNQLLRTAADYDNFRKRSRKELQDALAKAKEDVLREILPVIDNLERADQSLSTSSSFESVKDGISMVLRGFEEIAGRLNLKRIQAVGATFDPTVHDAVQQVETNAQAPGTIVSEVLPGYHVGDRLLRAALVVVAKAGASKRPESVVPSQRPSSEPDNLPQSTDDEPNVAENHTQE